MFKLFIKYRFFLNRMIDKELRGLSKNYKKFIILGHQRSGSTFLLSSLRSHKDVICFGEIFDLHKIVFGYSHPVAPFLLPIRNHDPVSFLNKYVYRRFGDHIKMVGFKLFSFHLKKNDPLWNWIRDENIKIVVLTRKNLLAYYTSLEKAKMSNAWTSKHKERSELRLKLDPEACQAAFIRFEKNLSKLERLIEGKNVLRISYEELTGNKEATLETVQKFLGLEIRPLSTSLEKQEKNELSRVIINYDELKAFFSQTKWSEHFE